MIIANKNSQIELRRAEYPNEGSYAYKEEYKIYPREAGAGNYQGLGYIEIVAGFDGEELQIPNLYIGGRFIPLSERVDQRCTEDTEEARQELVASYIRAKDVFYSEFKEGNNLILDLRVGINFQKLLEGDRDCIIESGTMYDLYEPVSYEADPKYTDDLASDIVLLYLRRVDLKAASCKKIKESIEQLYDLITYAGIHKEVYYYQRCLPQ
jgi:hypothetical protein